MKSEHTKNKIRILMDILVNIVGVDELRRVQKITCKIGVDQTLYKILIVFEVIAAGQTVCPLKDPSHFI